VNRAKVWVFTLLVVAFGFLLVRTATVSRRADAVAALDARLASAAAHVAASAASLMHEASAAAGLVARDARLRAALEAHAPPAPPPPPRGRKAAPAAAPADAGAEEAKLQEAARQALAAAERELGFDLPTGTVVSAGNREWLARKGEPGPAEGEALGLLRAAIGGQPRRGFVRLNEGLWYGAAAPAGGGAGVSILVPLDASWVRPIAAAAGADVTITAPEVKPVSTARAADVPQLQQATKLAGAGDVGSPGKVDVSFGPVALPRLPQPVAGGAPLRARAIAVEGVPNAFAIVSIPAAASVQAPAAFFWRAVAGLAVVLLAGIVVGLMVGSGERAPQIPDELHAAAARIEKGDFAARAPPLAGKLGTLAAALNRAAELAGPAQAARGAPPAPATTGEWYQGPPPEAAQLAPAPAAQPGAAPPLAAPAPAAGGPVPAFEVDEETHWQQVFQDFLRTRASCGEPSEGLTYDRFRQKLEGNKAQLVAKYGCKSVRFQVYVKDGKAALKATPVK
jgi:hypothetical protein